MPNINYAIMYKRVFRPIMFMFPPETIHHIIAFCLKLAFIVPFGKSIFKSLFVVKSRYLEREVCGIKFPNPVGIAAGFDKDCDLYNQIQGLGFGFMEVGTIVPKVQYGNPKPRLFRLPKDSALINRMGFPSKGLKYSSHKLLKRTDKSFILGGNLGKNTATPNEKAAEDYLTSFRTLYDSVEYFVVNVSCPNVANLTSLQNNDSLREILSGLIEFRRGQNEYRPIMLKIAPTLTLEQLDDMLEVVAECGVDGIVATNTTTSRKGLLTPQKRIEEIKNGGLSGAPLKDRAVEMVRYIHQKTEGQLAIVAVGGIMNEDDAVEMLKAGASLILLYTGFIYGGPFIAKRICKRLISERKAGNI